MKTIILSGTTLRNELGSKKPIRKGEYRLLLKRNEVQRLFGEDTDWLLRHLSEGEGQLKCHYYIFVITPTLTYKIFQTDSLSPNTFFIQLKRKVSDFSVPISQVY
jgi:hypothetical protein